MKIGDIICYRGLWGVIFKIKGSYAIFRFQNFHVSEYFSPLESYTESNAYHDWKYIDLCEWYTEKELNLNKWIYYSIYRKCENIWGFMFCDDESFAISCILMFIIAFLLALIAAAAQANVGI